MDIQNNLHSYFDSIILFATQHSSSFVLSVFRDFVCIHKGCAVCLSVNYFLQDKTKVAFTYFASINSPSLNDTLTQPLGLGSDSVEYFKRFPGDSCRSTSSSTKRNTHSKHDCYSNRKALMTVLYDRYNFALTSPVVK